MAIYIKTPVFNSVKITDTISCICMWLALCSSGLKLFMYI